MKNIVVLISGNGSNLAALAQAAQRDDWQGRYQSVITGVISNRPGAAGLALARQMGLSTQVLDHTDFASEPDPRAAFDNSLVQAIDQHQPALVVLAGFMRLLTAQFVRHYQRRLVNIHPSLLPAFKGLHTHQRALDAGCRFAGATVHWVDEALDGGEIIDQVAVPILPSDTATDVAQRVLSQEHLLYPRAIASLLAVRQIGQASGPEGSGCQA